MMKKVFLFTLCWSLIWGVEAQSVSQQLQKAYQQFEKDDQLKHAISSLYVIDAKTGQVVFDKNSQIGLAPASTQKIITSVTAFEMLGKEYKYKTQLAYDGVIQNGVLNGNLFIIPSGDPTFGSWRWKYTNEEKIINDFVDAVNYLKIKNITGAVSIDAKRWSTLKTPDGWIMQDVGNYYGAGAFGLNWRENQFDVYLKSGENLGEPVQIIKYYPKLYNADYKSELISAAKGSGDKAYIFQHPNVIRGTIPIKENMFKISGSIEFPMYQFLKGFCDTLLQSGVDLNSPAWGNDIKIQRINRIYTHYSPSLDSIIYWFNKKSINLYGEALIKTFAYEKQGFGSTDSGVAIVKKFWKGKGLDEDELNIYDGSGLSPLNRVTTHAQVEILKYAKTKDWFPYFLKSLPDYNGMTMKSGTISDVKGYCGYHTAKDGKEYIFSFLVNNYSGKTSGVVGKMYKVLDELK